MDGWESRRKRDLSNGAHDYCVIRLAHTAIIHGFDVDTANFTGNYPDHCMIEGALIDDEKGAENLAQEFTELAPKSINWIKLIGKNPLQGGSHNYFTNINRQHRFNYIRLHIYPDGGVARLRVYGKIHLDIAKIQHKIAQEPNYKFDLCALANGARVIAASNAYFGPKDNLILPGKAACMGEGWESKRRRSPGQDWIIVRLAIPGHISQLLIDTNHFKGNFPDQCSVEVSTFLSAEEELLPYDFTYLPQNFTWQSLVEPSKMQASHEHWLEVDSAKLTGGKAVSYVKLNALPDGGVSRFRAFGTPVLTKQ
jgi:allantoicase